MQHTNALWAALFGATIIMAGCSDNSTGTTEPKLPNNVADINPTVSADKAKDNEKRDVHIVTATGDILSAREDFRALLGDPSPNAPGEQAGGRREINWDGVPAAVTNTDNFPGNFFNVNSPRGLVTTTNGTGFRVSDNGYVDVNPHYAGEFNAFSPRKLFVAVGSTITDISFFVAGSNTPATVTGFGSVFEDVGRANSTTIEFFDVNGKRLLKLAAILTTGPDTQKKRLLKLAVPKRSDDNGQSFAGAVFASRIVARVRITSGNTPLGIDAFDNVRVNGKKVDLVTMDDFIYGEPRAN